LRQLIDEEWQQLESILENTGFKKEFKNVLQGDTLKRMPAGFNPEHPRANWLMLKEYIVYSSLKFEDIQSPKLIEIIERKAKAIYPFLNFLQLAVEDVE
jgi:uncharacterized protein (DUF2461 family)